MDLSIKYATISQIPCNTSDSFDLEPSVSIKSLSLAALMYVEEGIYRSLNLETGVDLLDKFIPGDSSLRDLGFISPIKPLKGSGSGYFLRSSSKGCLAPIISFGKRDFLTTDLSEEGIVLSNDFEALRVVEDSFRVSK